MNSKLFRNTLIQLIIIVVVFNVGLKMGKNGYTPTLTQPLKRTVVNTSPPPSREVDFALFWEVWAKLEERFLDKTKLDTEKMVHGAIAGMVNSLGDPYTVFLPPKENQDFKSDLEGAFEGIGAQLGSKDDKIVVIAPLKDHPAEKAGVRAGDWIIKVNDEETFGWTVPETVTKIRGPKGSSVKLSVVHEGQGETVDISVTRDKIIIKSVEVSYKQVDPTCSSVTCAEIAVVRLTRFGDTTNDEWNAAISEVDAKGDQIKGVVLDVRNNPGGYFQSAIYIASEFIKTGVVVKQENSDGSVETYSVTRVGNLLDVPLTVLINKGSASASEIVAGALKDHKRATLIGETTFGKGSIQSPEDLEGGSGIHITTARWVMPNGEWINGKGIKPDIEVKLDLSLAATASADFDPQLDKAIEELK